MLPLQRPERALRVSHVGSTHADCAPGGLRAGALESVRLDASELHHLAPLLGFGGDELAEVGRCCPLGRGMNERDQLIRPIFVICVSNQLYKEIAEITAPSSVGDSATLVRGAVLGFGGYAEFFWMPRMRSSAV